MSLIMHMYSKYMLLMTNSAHTFCTVKVKHPNEVVIIISKTHSGLEVGFKAIYDYDNLWI